MKTVQVNVMILRNYDIMKLRNYEIAKFAKFSNVSMIIMIFLIL